MRWFLFASLAVFAMIGAGRSLCAQEEDPAGHDHVEHPGNGNEPHSPDDGDGSGTEHDSGHAEHPPVYDGDNDLVDEDYNQPPLKELTAVRFLFALGLFVAFVFVMRKIAWVPLIAAFDAREARVNEAHAFAASSRDEIKDLIRQHEERISATHDEVKGIVAAARQEAEQAKSEIVAQALQEAQSLQAQSIAEINTAREEALGQLSSTVEDYTTLATEHVIGRGNRN